MPTSAHVIDSERADLIAEYRKIEQEINSHEDQLKAERYLDLSGGTTGTRVDPLKQWGRQMSHTELEKKIAPYLGSQFFCADHPTKPDTRWIYQLIGNDRVYVTAYNKGFLPEQSIHYVKEVIRPISGLFRKRLKEVGGVALSGRDTPELKKVANSEAPGGFVYEPKDPNALMPGWRKDYQLGPERIRGWRTVVIYLKNAGVLNTQTAETIFGAQDTPEWQGHMGKAKVTTPW